MPYKRDSNVWHSLTGITAAYQPIAAPSPLLSRANMASGGQNRYTAGTANNPTWSATTGWGFIRTSTQYFTTGIIPLRGQSTLIVRFSGAASVGGAAGQGLIGTRQTSACYIYLGTYWYADQWAGGNGTEVAVVPALASGVLAVAGLNLYQNGMQANTCAAGSGTNLYPIAIGSVPEGGVFAVSRSFTGNIQAAAIYGRNLSATEVWNASRQMAYCHMNPDWSVWGRRRKYYYAPSEAAAGGAAGDIFASRIFGGGVIRR